MSICVVRCVLTMVPALILWCVDLTSVMCVRDMLCLFHGLQAVVAQVMLLSEAQLYVQQAEVPEDLVALEEVGGPPAHELVQLLSLVVLQCASWTLTVPACLAASSLPGVTNAFLMSMYVCWTG